MKGETKRPLDPMYDKSKKEKGEGRDENPSLSIPKKARYPCRFVTATVRSLPSSRLLNSPLALVSFLSCIM